jgi:hypothetical protein
MNASDDCGLVPKPELSVAVACLSPITQDRPLAIGSKPATRVGAHVHSLSVVVAVVMWAAATRLSKPGGQAAGLSTGRHFHGLMA